MEIIVGEVESGDFIKLKKNDSEYVEVVGRLINSREKTVSLNLDYEWTPALPVGKIVYLRDEEE